MGPFYDNSVAQAPSEKLDKGEQNKLNLNELISSVDDVDGDGKVDEKDRKIKEMLRSMDSDGDGMISATEMVRVVQKKLQGEKKLRNMRRLIVVVVVVALVFIALSLGTVIASIEMTKESRNRGGVQIDVKTGQPVKSDTLTAGDSRMVDASGATIATKKAKARSILTSKMTLSDLRLLTDMQLPVESASGQVDTLWFTVNGFYQASDGSLLELYTPGGALITVKNEDIYVSLAMPGDENATRLHVVPSTRRRTMRRRLMQAAGPDKFNHEAAVFMECGSGNCDSGSECTATEEYNVATGSCMCPLGMAFTDAGEWCKCSGENEYAAWVASTGKYSACTSCPTGSVPDELGTACLCDQAVWDESTNTCSKQCPPGLELVEKELGWGCECPGCAVQMRNGQSVVCEACQESFVAAVDPEGVKSCVADVEGGLLSQGMTKATCV